MAQKLDYSIPFNDLIQYVPQNLRNPVIKGLIDNLFNRHMTHDESVPLYGYIGQKPSSIDDKSIKITQPTVERDINAIVPVLNFTLGSERYAFTVQDIVNKAKALGISAESLEWLYSQSNNYLPPIDIDKFANFYNYFWVANSLPTKPVLAWNPDLAPEYYVIAPPKPADLNKLNVLVATTGAIIRTGTGFEDQSFTVEFLSPTQFKITADVALGAFTTSGLLNSSGIKSFTYNLNATPVTSVPTEQTFTFNVTNGSSIVTLMTFAISRNPIYDSNGVWTSHEGFSTGDTFFIDTVFLSSTYNITFSISAGVKGRFKNINSLKTYQSIDGILLSEGVRVLVKNSSSAENGIYIVRAQTWVRAADYAGVNIVQQARVWVRSGSINGGRLFTSGPGNSWPAGVLTANNTNDWQEGNFWIHRSDLDTLGISRANVLQADCPIIEYSSILQLNSFIAAGAPAEKIVGLAGVSFKQTKTEFNQLPMFDLFRYDGTHSNLVSSVFYYVEDLTASLDLDLQRRVKLSSSDSADYIFDHGLVDADGDLLFYKVGSALKTIWHPGYTQSEEVDEVFIGATKGKITELIPTTAQSAIQTWTLTATSPATFSISGSISGMMSTEINVGVRFVSAEFSVLISSRTIPFTIGEAFTFSISSGPTLSPIAFIGPVKGTLSGITAQPYTQQQVWTFQAITPTTFSVFGSKTAALPAPFNVITVGILYSSSDFSCFISAGTLAFDIGDAFVLRIGNLERPRYVYRDSTDAIYDLYGGKAADANGVGAHQVSRPFINNPYNSSRDEILEGTLNSHFRGILQSQPIGASSNYAFGGSIKNWSEQQTLFASLMMQRDLTPISMIDMAQRQYEIGLNSISLIFKKNIIQYYTLTSVVDPDGTSIQDQKLNDLLDYILALRSLDQDVRTVLYDTTSAVIGIPATLPQLGILELVQPQIAFDNLLGQVLLTHHDGHNSHLETDNLEFRRSLIGISGELEVLRSDFTITPAVGSFNNTEPTLPYRGSLWLRPSGADVQMLAFDVDGDADIPILPNDGFKWYDRIANVISIWNNSTLNWDIQTGTTQFWRVVNFADLLNRLRLLVETRLFDGINPNARKIDFAPLLIDPIFKDQLKRELFTFAANNGLNPLGSDYVASNSLSWNYSNASSMNFPAGYPSVVPARWTNVLKTHQAQFPTVIPTERPNFEPWKLLGFSTYQTWAASPLWLPTYEPYLTIDELLNPQTTELYTSGGTVRVVKTDGSFTNRNGSQIIDSVTVIPGNLVLLQNEPTAANNGIWVVQSGFWTRATIPLVKDTFVSVIEGLTRYNTVWILTANPIGPSNAVLFKQVRYWSDILWADIKVIRGANFRLSVDTIRDDVLPPYVPTSNPQSQNALTTVMPTGIEAPYTFGEGAPVETVWYSTMEFGYSLARALFRHDPMLFLGFCWGFNWVQVDGIVYDGYDLNTPGHKRFRLHGDLNRVIERDSANATISGPNSVSIKYDAYEVAGSNRYQNFTIRGADGLVLGYAREGVLTSIGSLSILIQDRGVPFHIGDTFELSSTGGVTFIPAIRHQYLGFGQTFTNALRELSVDTTDSYAIDAYRGWDVNLGHRAGGLVSTDDLKVRTADDTLSSSSFDLLFKKNSLAKSLWVQGLRITVQQFGSKVSMPVSGFAPTTNGADWVFNIEGYNPRYLNVSYYALDTNSSFQTFNVLDQSVTNTIWKQYTDVVSTVQTYLPLTIVGIQNVVSFLFGYSQLLSDEGWVFNQDPMNNVDAETGRSRTWQLEIEKFIDRCYRGIDIRQGHIVNPFMDKIWVRQDMGLLSQFIDTSLFDITADPGVFDITGVRLQSNELNIIRGNLESSISGNSPMFSVHATIDEYEHLFVFKYFVEDSISKGLLYDPFSGARIQTYNLNGRRQAVQTFRPEFGGHYLVGNEVRQNLQASTDNITNFYDANRAFENNLTSQHSLSLLGFNKKDYFSNLDISDKSQFNFWRGLIQAKGTNLSIGAYLNNDRFKDAKIDEFWAYKIAQYGDSRQLSYPEMKLNVGDTLQQFTQLQFDARPGFELPNFTQISRIDESRWFSIDDLDQDAYFKAEVIGTFTKSVSAGEIVDLGGIADRLQIGNVKFFVRAGSTGNIIRSLASTPNLDGVSLIVGDRVLIKNQSLSLENGVYTVISSGTWTRVLELNTLSELNNTSFIEIQEGSQGGSWYGRRSPFVSYTYELIGRRVNAATIQHVKGGNLSVVGYGAAVPKYNPVKLFNYADDELIEEIPHWHPAAGQHTPSAMESVNIISSLNPAKYNFSTQVVNNNSYDPLRPWGDNELGRVWFDTTNLSYIQYYDDTVFPSRAERLSRWGATADFASIDVYEWVRSEVPPEQYNALALTQAGDADLDSATKAAGEVALEETYLRDRQWSIRPIAWSEAGVPNANAHPSFNGSFEDQLNIDDDGTMWLETATFASFNIEAGMRIGLWDPKTSDPKPLSEAIVTNQFSKKFVGNIAAVPNFTVGISMLSYTGLVGDLVFSAPVTVGVSRLDSDGVAVSSEYAVSLNLQTDFGAEEIVLYTLIDPTPLTVGIPTMSLASGQTLVYDFTSFGIRVSVLVNVSNSAYAGTAVVTSIVAALGSSIAARDAVSTSEVVPSTGTLSIATNNPDDSAYGANIALFYGYISIPDVRVGTNSNITFTGLQTVDGITLVAGNRVLVKNQTVASQNGVYVASVGSWVLASSTLGNFLKVLEGVQNGRKYFVRTSSSFVQIEAPGWRAWSVPTQAELDADGRQRNSSWKPYVGEYQSIQASLAQIQDAVSYSRAPLTLNDGTIIEKYYTTWADWAVLRNTILSSVQLTNGSLTIENAENIDSARTSVYVNGITQLAASFTIDGNTLVITNVNAGSTAKIIIRHYEPTAAEIAFDPAITDDLTFQSQYKKDFEYVSLPVRDIEGSISSITYYFWVKNKSTVAFGKKQSVQAIVQNLRAGPPNYLTFQNFLEAETIGGVSYPNRYDAITLSGLSYVVAKDDTFKLRFTRNFTLRDDPEQLDLKDTHTEWMLIRSGQRTRIPEALWLKLTDSLAGQDLAANPVPSLRRVLYDERNGSSSRYGFKTEQTLAPQDLLVSSVTDTIVNTKLTNTNVPANSDGVYPSDFIEFLNFNESETWFDTPESTRQTMTDIWISAKPVQINEIFFAALNDILANNLELTDLFKTSRLAAYSIKVANIASAALQYE